MAGKSAMPISCFPWSARFTRRRSPSIITITSWSARVQCRPVHGNQPAAEKLEKQCLKARTKWRDAKRTAAQGRARSGDGEVRRRVDADETRHQVYKVKPAQKRKPMTVEEAVLEMDKSKDYLVYRDAQTDKVSVLLRRRDGHFDLVEG